MTKQQIIVFLGSCGIGGSVGAVAASGKGSSQSKHPGSTINLSLDKSSVDWNFGTQDCVKRFELKDSDVLSSNTTLGNATSWTQEAQVTPAQGCLVFHVSYGSGTNQKVVSAKFELTVSDKENISEATKGVIVRSILTNALTTETNFKWLTRVIYLSRDKTSEDWKLTKGFEFENKEITPNTNTEISIKLGRQSNAKTVTLKNKCQDTCTRPNYVKGVMEITKSIDNASGGSFYQFLISSNNKNGVFFGTEINSTNTKNKVLKLTKVYDSTTQPKQWQNITNDKVTLNQSPIKSDGKWKWEGSYVTNDLG